MDDQQGNVFDGTARSREWRRRRLDARSQADAAAPRSEAPKSIAGSLLVPAEMLSGRIPTDQPASNGTEQAALPRGRSTAVDGTSGAERARQNPFLFPPAESAVPHSRLDRWRVSTARLAGSVAWMRLHLRSAPLWGPRTIARHLSGAPHLVRGLALAALAAIPITVVIASQAGTGHSPPERNVRAAGLLGAPGTDALSASSNPLAQRAAQHDRAPHHVRRIRARRTTREHRRPHPATKHVVVAAQYTPSASRTASYTPSSTSSSYAGSGSTPVSSQSTGGATTSSSSSGSSRPAFGEHGILGPGRGAANTQ